MSGSRKTREQFIFVVSFLILVVGGVACKPGQSGGTTVASSTGIRAWLDQPFTGANLPLGAFTLKAHARDTAGGGVRRVVFLVNTIALGTVNTDPTQPLVYAEFGWNPSVAGNYRIQAQAFNATGSALSEVAVVCVGPDCDASTPTASPLSPKDLVPTPTFTPATQATCKGAPVISSFAATPSTLAAAGTSTLSWSVSNADRVELAGSGVVGLTGSQSVSVSATNTYNLVAYCGGKENFVQKSVTVTVSAAAKTACSGLPVVTFSASPTAIDVGGSSTLRWTVTNASEVALVGTGVVGATGSRTVTPGSATTYTLTAFCGSKANLVERSVTVTVRTVAAPPPPVCGGTPNIASFGASPASISAGASSTLSWGAVTNADSVSIDQGIGGVPAPGSRAVSPGGTTTYTMTARCGNNVATKQTTVSVTAAPPPPPQDTTPPSISGVKPNSSNLTYPTACSGYPSVLTVAASVSDPSGVSSVQLYYRFVPNKGTASGWSSVTMSSSGGGYSGTANVGSQAYTPLGGGNGNVEYYVTARDNAGNSGNSSTGSVSIQYCPG